MLQAAEISKGRTVSHPIPYCQPQAKPQDGSINRQMYMVKASKLLVLSLDGMERHGQTSVDWVHDSKLSKSLHHQVNHDSDDNEADKNSSRSTSLEGSSRTDEQTGSNSTTTVIDISIACYNEAWWTNCQAQTQKLVESRRKSHTWQSSACVCPSSSGGVCLDQPRQWLPVVLVSIGSSRLESSLTSSLVTLN